MFGESNWESYALARGGDGWGVDGGREPEKRGEKNGLSSPGEVGRKENACSLMEKKA